MAEAAEPGARRSSSPFASRSTDRRNSGCIEPAIEEMNGFFAS
jgi:hypothetical protein